MTLKLAVRGVECTYEASRPLILVSQSHGMIMPLHCGASSYVLYCSHRLGRFASP